MSDHHGLESVITIGWHAQPTPHDIQLMSKHRVLSFKPQLRLEWQRQDGQHETEQPDHSASLCDSITSSTRIKFSVHTRAPTITSTCREPGAATLETSAPIAQSVTPTTISRCTRPPLIRAFQAIHAGASRHCRWLGKAKLSVTSVAN